MTLAFLLTVFLQSSKCVCGLFFFFLPVQINVSNVNKSAVFINIVGILQT